MILSPAKQMPPIPGMAIPQEPLDSLRLPNGDWVLANTRQVWLHRDILPGMNALVEHLSEPGDPERLRQLLAGVLSAALRQRRPTPTQETATWRRHVWSLATSYQTTHATPPTMTRVAEGFEAAGRKALADWCRHVADEESGHDALALRDLTALGLRAEALVAEVRPTNALALVDLFQSLADGAEPVAVLGYAYVLERIALFTTLEQVQAIEASLPPGVKATRCLRVHSAAGTDVRHVRESLEFIATLPAPDRQAIMRGAFATASLMAAAPDYPGDAAIDSWVARFRI
jgi:hypothetical protein